MSSLRGGPLVAGRGDPGRRGRRGLASFRQIKPPAGRRPKRPAFTLIELLVVIAIIALLLTLLMPTLARVRDIAAKVMCATNMHQAGIGALAFAQMHEGRFPNKADSSVEYWDPVWMNLLNREYYHNNEDLVYPTSAYGDEPTCGPLLRFWTFSDPQYYDNNALNKKWMTCTAYKAWGSGSYSNIWSRPWMMNRYATGGCDWDIGGSACPWQGVYGKLVPNPTSIHRNYRAYALGTKMEAFNSPSSKFLIWEGERGSDITNLGGTVDNGSPKLNADPSYGPYCTSEGFFAFRHLLPRDVRLYQQQARANVLYVDGHVAELKPTARYATGDSFWLSP